MKFSSKRLLAVVLAFVLVLSLFPVTQPMHVHAAGKLDTVDGLSASWTDASSTKGIASWSASGTAITGTAKGYTQLIFGRTITTTLTLTNSSGSDATLKFNWTLNNGGSVSGAITGSSGAYEKVLAAGQSVTITLTSPSGANTNTLSMTGISLISTSAADVTTTFKPATEGGSYKVGGEVVNASTPMTGSAGSEYALEATPASGYIFFGWFNETNSSYIGYDASCTYTAAADAVIVPKFVANTTALFGVGAAKFDDLTEAGNFAAAGSNNIVILLNNGTVSGSHTIPAGVTLLVPFDEGNTLYTTTPDNTNKNLLNTASYVKPTAYRTLTLAADADITVNGSISVSGKHFAGGGDVKKGGGGVPTGPVGFVQMVSGSKITLNSGANLYAWGFVTGAGTITAKNGAKVYENFQVRDFRGGGATTSIANDGIVFPLSQYYVQNIEVPTAYEYGAEEHIYTSFYISGMSYSAGVKFIGDGAMFQPEAGCVLTKDYIENQDRLLLTVEGNSSMSSMSLSLAGTDIDSSTFILPINGNITINIKSGTTTLKQDLALLPGAELTIAKDAVLDLASGAGSGTISDGTGYNLFVYDLDEWSSGYNTESFNPDDLDNSPKSTGLNFVHQSYKFIALDYAPGRTYTRTAADLKDVKVDVNGTIVTNGFLYTTLGGANIISSEKSGVIAMNSGAGAEQWTYQAAQVDTTPVYYAILCNSAALKNGDGTYLSTVGAEEDTTYNYCATCDCWYTGEHTCGPKAYEITWIVDGKESTQEFDIGVAPVYNNGVNPTKATVNCTTFTFAGWKDANGNVYAVGEALPAGENTFTAQFTEGTSHVGDTDKDHLCNGCGTSLSSCADNDSNHYCDVCGNVLSSCVDGDDDNHNCDYTGCNAENVDGGHHGGTATCMAPAVCDECGQSYGSKNSQNHTGNNTTGVNAKDPTCGAEGYTGDTVCECGETVAYGTSIPATGKHNYTNEISRTDATCMAEGSVTKQCACGATETTDLPINKDNHTGNNTTDVNAKEPTCGAEGYTGDTVCECGETVAYGTSIPATGKHNYTNEISRTDATCMAEGSVTKQCACGATETTDLPINKDNHTGEVVYTNNGDTHSAVYDCCNAAFVTGESHDYTTGDADHTCICGAIETFTVTWRLNGGVLDEQTKQSLIEEGFVITDAYVSNAFPYGEFAPHAPGISKTGYTLVGYTDQDGNSYQGQDKFTLNQNMTFTLNWEINTYTLTVSVLATGEIVELTVPYGANLLEILAQAAEDGKIPALGDEFRVISNYENGMYFISGYSYFIEAEDYWVDVDEASTMPAADFEIDQDWSMLTGWIYSDVDEDGTFDGAEYYDARNDNPYMTGWQYIEEDYDDIPGGAWYYFTSYMIENGIFYHFRAEGISRVPYNTELGYGPDQETVDYAQANGIEFIDATTGLFVFDENGKFQMNYTGPVIDGEYARYAVNGHIAWHVGMVENQGAYFYFLGDEVNGGNIMATGDVYVIRNTSDFPAVIGGIYTFDVDGSLKIFKGIVENDLFEGKRYYVAGRLMIGYGLCDITEKVDDEWVTNYFYVRSDGTLAVNTRYWVAKTNGLDFAVGEYEFDENGFMIIPVEEPAKDGIYFENGAWYYYENGAIGYNKGLIFTDKSWYDADGNSVWGEGGTIYVRSNGQLATGKYYVTNLSNYSQIVDVVAGTPLQFDEYGLMGSVKNGIVDGYYYVNNQIVYAAGLIQIDGNYYYVRSNGQVVMGREYWISNANDTGIKLGCYTFDENGVMQIPETYGFTGIKDGYYYIDGAVAYGAGVVMLDDSTYIYVRSNGQLAVGKYWPTTLNGYLAPGEYDFGEDGILTVE